ncbi:MAG: NUDIX domain-containing protein [Candidatus Saccharimonas sp.]|nr:NUDIX domain-containing protein [Candidatus Saccharimonas sp.]
MQYGKYPQAFYRVSVKAVIRDEKGWVLCVSETERNFWELPGGGLDHGETVQQGLARELEEEIGYIGKFSYAYADITTLYTDTEERCTMNIAFNVILADPGAICAGRDVFQMGYKDPEQFKDVDYRGGQLIYKHAVDHNFPIKFDRR